MPLYAYRCTQCGYQYDKIQKFNDAPETVCPKCGGTVERLLTAPAFKFEGAGWYINDYAPKAASGGSANAAKPAAETSSAAPAASAPSTASGTGSSSGSE